MSTSALHHRPRTILIATFVIAIGALIVYLVVSILLYIRLASVQAFCAGEYANNTPANFNADPFSPALDTRPYWMPTYEDVRFQSDVMLSGWYVPAADPNAPAVIVVHGLGAGAADCKRNPRALMIAGMLHRAGFHTFLIDLRQHGDSTVTTGLWSGNTHEHRDVIAAYQWLIDEKGIAPDRVGVAGYSGGTGAALIAMSEEPRIAAAWLDSVYTDIPSTIEAVLEQAGIPGWFATGGFFIARITGNDLTAYNPINAAVNINGRPIFITHSDADPFLSPAYADQMLAALREHGNDPGFWQIHSDTHVRAMFDQTAEYERRLVEFFTAAL